MLTPMSYQPEPRRDAYFAYADVKPRVSISIALGLAVTSFIPGLGITAIPALVLALAADGRREHPITNDRAHRAQMVAIISLCIQIVVIVGLLVLGVSTSDLKGVTDV